MFNILQRWPRDYLLHVWYPHHCQLKQGPASPSPPSHHITASNPHTPQHTTTPSPNSTSSTATSTSSSVEKKSFASGWRLSPIKAHCLRPRYGRGDGEDEKAKSSVSGGLTRLAGCDLDYKELKVMGFCLGTGADREEQGEGGVVLELSTWLDGSIQKSDFIKRGWAYSSLENYVGPEMSSHFVFLCSL